MQDLTLVFDLDGTLIDTAPDLISTVNRILATQKLAPLPSDLLRPKISFGARAMIETALRAHRIEPDEPKLDELFELFIEMYMDNIAVDSRPFDGINLVLDTFRKRGTKLAVCTNKREDMTLVLLKALNLDHRFDTIAGRDTFDVFKPHPDHLTRTIDRAGGKSSRAIMIGDSQTDISTADAADIPVIGVTFGYSDPPMQQLHPTRMIDDYAQFDKTVSDLLCSDVFATGRKSTPN